MTTTTDIARAHGHKGPTSCQDCGTTENVHFGSWWNPETQEGGTLIQCCNCGIRAGDPIYTHAEEECGAPATRYVPNVNGDPYSQLAHQRINDRAFESYLRARREVEGMELEGAEADKYLLTEVLESVGRAYAAAALNRAAQVLVGELSEDSYLTLSGIAATLDLDVVEDLDGANGLGENAPEVRAFHRADGWEMNRPEPEACTSNFQRQQDGRPACMETAVWKVVEDHGMHLSIGFYCDADLPAERRHLAVRPAD
ncbi:hypothetical protein [Streptomyces sp. NPDC047990]|uniref:hypothetical protein n=1 Tax=Streptomyces sp. NPDC047990 TaxID=3365496 RepID=UPI003713F3C7